MIVKFSLSLPFWIYGENKIASKVYLNQWLDLNGIDYNNSFKVNELNKDNITIISKSPGVRYVVMEINHQMFYYYQTNIEFIANNTYQISLTLDWYATYGLIVINQLSGKNVFVKRSHHVLSNVFETALFQDERLENISPVFSNITFFEDQYERIEAINGKNYYYIGSYGYTLDQYHFINLYGVWKAKAVDGRTGYYIYPITNETNIITSNMSVDGRTTSMNGVKSFCNAIGKIRDINTNTNWANGFLGIFTGPNFLKIFGVPEVSQIGNTSSPSLISRVFSTSYFQSYNIASTTSFNYHGNQKLLLNHTTGLYSPNILNYMDVRMGNSKLDALNFELTSNNQFKLKDGYIGFNESNFTFFNKLTLDDFNETVKPFPGPLISEANPYLEYIAQNKNRINSSLILGGLSMGGALASGNPIIGAAGLVGGAGSMINQITSLKDAKNRMLNKPNPSYDNDNAFYGLSYLLDGVKSTSMIYYRELNNLAKYNNEIVYYGWKQERYLPFNTTGLNKHFYIQIDANETYNNYSYVFESIPKIYLDQILELLNNGIRLWKDKDVQYE